MRATFGVALILGASLALLAQQPPVPFPGQGRSGGLPPGAQRGPQAQQGQEAEEVKPEDRGSIHGSVTSAATGEPLKKARLMLRRVDRPNETPVTTQTDAAGRYVLEQVDPGRYMLTVMRAGYANQSYGQRQPGTQGSMLAVEPRETLKDIDFKLNPAAVITGRVVDEDSEPVMNARVSAMRYRYIQGRRQLVPAGMGSTNDLGEYRLFGLEPGRYFISVMHLGQDMGWMGARAQRGAGRRATGDITYGTVYYPGTRDESQAAALAVRGGEERRGVDFNLRPVEAMRVAGTLLNGLTGGPIRNTAVMLSPARGRLGGPPRQARVGEDGTFEFSSVESGSYILIANAGMDQQRLSAQTAIQVGNSDVEGLQIRVMPPVEVQGTVRIESAAEVAMDRVRIFARPEEQTPFMGGSAGSVTSTGAFLLRNISDGKYNLSVFGLGEQYYLKSAKIGNADILMDGLTIRDGMVPGELELVVSDDGGAVDGIVFGGDQHPASGVTVVLVPERNLRSRPDLFKQSSTDQYGRFTMQGLMPGEYSVFAFDKAEPGAFQDPEFLQLYENQGKTIRLASRDKQSLDLKAIEVPQE